MARRETADPRDDRRGDPHTPVFVSRYDGHMALANTLVLKRAGITRDTPDPPGGSIVRDPRTGEPTGILKDEAMGAVWGLVPAASDTERIEAAELALDEARKYGLTIFKNISSSEDVRTYRRLLEQGKLTARIYCRLPLGQWGELAAQKIHAGSGDEWIRGFDEGLCRRISRLLYGVVLQPICPIHRRGGSPATSRWTAGWNAGPVPPTAHACSSRSTRSATAPTAW